MKRVLILGCCGAGKSTFSRELARYTHLPIIHLDQHYFDPNWKEKNKSTWNQIVANLAQQEEWIMDGNYASSLNLRLPRADTIVYLDNGTISNIYRVIKRIIKYHGQERPDAASGCKERFDLEFLHYVLVFNWVRKPGIINTIYQYEAQKEIAVLRNNKEREDWLSLHCKAKR